MEPTIAITFAGFPWDYPVAREEKSYYVYIVIN